VFGLFQRSPNEALIDRLHGEIMAGARQPAFFVDYGVADTLEGRFEILCLVASMAVRRIGALPPPGPDLAQEITDSIFRHFDVALRQVGVGDLTVPKKMKKMAQGYLGRASAYGATLDGGDDSALALALARNVFGDEGRAGSEECVRLARYARTQEAAFATLDVEAVLRGPLPFVDPQGV
jgi:cytochrome b pre-mRNA-processing protein 3